VNRLRQFATSNTLQILIINIDAFRKNFTGTEEEQKSNVIYKESDKLSGRQPIEFVQAARPIVIIDEPQSVDSTEKAQEAIKALNPLCTLRYSATHRNPYNLAYRLDPVRAFELKLVKQIVVASATVDGGANDAFVRVETIDYKKGIKAKLRIHVQTVEGPKEKAVTVKNGADLFALSNERANYAQGFSVAEINAEPGNEFIRFSNGRTLRLGEVMGGMREDVWRAQIKHTIKRHLEKELQVRARGIKVLSLFFIDRVANYRDYDAAGPHVKGKFAEAFEAELAVLVREERFRDMANERYEDFARALQTEYEEDCGVTCGKVPLSTLAKLTRVVDGPAEQPIGREATESIRTALVTQKMLDAEGRIQPAFDPKCKDFKLELPAEHCDLAPAVIDLLSAYQIERHIRKDRDEGPNRLKKEVTLSREFQALWERIKPRTTYRVEFEADTLVQRAVSALKRMERIEKPRVRVTAGQIGVRRAGVSATGVSVAEEQAEYGRRPVPDLLAYLQNETDLTRSTLVRILKPKFPRLLARNALSHKGIALILPPCCRHVILHLSLKL
jgi:Restriction endonuclease